MFLSYYIAPVYTTGAIVVISLSYTLIGKLMDRIDCEGNGFKGKIRNRLFRQFLISLALVLIVIGAFLHYFSYSIIKNMVFQKAEVRTQLAYELLTSWVGEDRLAIRSFSNLLSFQELSKKKVAEFIKFEKERFLISTPFVAYDNGDFITNGWTEPSGYLATERPWYIASKKFYSDKSNLNSVYYSKPYVSAVDDKVVFTMTSPILNGDVVEGLVGLDVDIAELEKKITSVDNVMGSWYVVSEEGFLLVSGSSTKVVGDSIFEGSQGHVYKEVLGADKIVDLNIHQYKRGDDNYFYIRDPATRWVIAYRVNNKVVDSQVIILNYGLLGAALLLLAVFALIISIVSSKFTLPIVRLAREAEKIAEGNFDCKIESKLRDELGYLTYRFNFMAKGLKEREEYEKNQAKIDIELKAGQEIQMSMLPKELLVSELFSSYAFYSSAQDVGGDFFDYFEISESCVVFCIGDVSGKGVPAAIFMAMVCTLIRNICRKTVDPASALAQLNDAISSYNSANMFATVFLAYYNPISGECTFANGGHNPVYLIGKDGVKTSEKTVGMLIGGFIGVEYRCGHFKLEKGDSVIMFTDGITEAHSTRDELYGDSRLECVLLDNSLKSIREIGESIIKDVSEFQQGEQFDDITLLGWRRN